MEDRQMPPIGSGSAAEKTCPGWLGAADEEDTTRVAGVILYRDGRVLLQHRDNKPEISWADAWAFFGGHAEPGEEPEQTARREIEEELGLRIEGPLELVYHARTGRHERCVFAAPLEVPLEDLVQTEGQGMALIARDELDHYRIVTLHRKILEEEFRWGC
jgi:8-oxo-dGTP diphosphatase